MRFMKTLTSNIQPGDTLEFSSSGEGLDYFTNIYLKRENKVVDYMILYTVKRVDLEILIAVTTTLLASAGVKPILVTFG